MVDVNPVNKNTSVNVSSSGTVSQIKTTTPQSYFDGLSKQWAISEDKVQGLDYSSKYYAQQAKENSQEALGALENVETVTTNAINQITTTKNETLDGIYDISSQTQQEIIELKETLKADLENTKVNAIDEVVQNKTNALDEIENRRSDAVEQIETLSEETLSEIKDLGVETRANLDLSNLSETGEKHFLGKSNITNCWTKIPQRIKYTLADGTLTILAGSVAIFPYGTQDKTAEFPIGSEFIKDTFKVVDTYWDGSKFFVWAELLYDKTLKDTSINNTTGSFFVFVSPSGALWWMRDSLVSSGSAYSSGSIFYDTTNNTVKRTEDNGATFIVNGSLPIVLIDVQSDVITSVFHTFNGWGYIGGCFWYEELEGLISNGYNNDGTYKNYVVKTPKIIMRSEIDNITREFVIHPDGTNDTPTNSRCFEQETEPNITGTASNKWYNPKANKIYRFNGTNWYERPSLKLFTFTADGTNITSVTDTPQTFRPLDIKDKKFIQGFVINALMPDYTKGIHCATLPYTAPANGWIIGYINRSTTNAMSVTIDSATVAHEADDYCDVQCPILKGQVLSATTLDVGSDRNNLYFYPMKGN